MPTPELQRPQLPGEFDFSIRSAHDANGNANSVFWIEQIDNISPASEEFSPRYAHATLYAYVPNNRTSMYNFVNQVLGFHYTSPDFKHIKRTNPIRHPKYENLYATKISEVKGVRFGSRSNNTMSGRASGAFSLGAGPAEVNEHVVATFTGSFGGNSLIIGSTNIAAAAVTVGLQVQGTGLVGGSVVTEVSSDANGNAIITISEPTSAAGTAATLSLVAFDEVPQIGTATDDTNKGLTEYAIYDRNLVSVEFAPPKWKMRGDESIKGRRAEDDTEIYQEWKRYCDYDTKTNIYDVSIQSGQFVYQEGAPKGIAFQGEINYFEVKTSFSLRWRAVPDDWVFDTTSYEMGYPTKLNAMAARVNKYAFMGYPAGTLLLLEPETERYVSGTLRRDDPSGDNLPFYMCDVILPIIHFDPKYGGTARGHNLKPWRRVGDSQLTYYLVKYTDSNGTPGNLLVYGEADFDELFRHWST